MPSHPTKKKSSHNVGSSHNREPISAAGQARVSAKLSKTAGENKPRDVKIATALSMERRGKLGSRGGKKK